MDARPKTRQVDRERKTPSTQVPRGRKQIVIPMTQQQYDDIWHDADRVRSFIEQCTGRLRIHDQNSTVGVSTPVGGAASLAGDRLRRDDMYWYRLDQRLADGLVETTKFRDADRFHATFRPDGIAPTRPAKGYITTTVSSGCVLGMALTAAPSPCRA